MTQHAQHLLDTDPREFLMELVDEGGVDPRFLLKALLERMSQQEIRAVLDEAEKDGVLTLP